MQPEYSGRTVEPAWSTLRNQELRRVQQKTIIDRQSTADRRLPAKPETNGMGPFRLQVLGLDKSENVAGRNRSWIALPKQIANAPKDVAAVIKRHHLSGPREGNSRFQIDDRKCVSANRNGKRVQRNQVPFSIAKQSQRNHSFTWSCFLEIKAAQRRRTAGEETFADRQGEIDLVDGPILIAISRVEDVRESKRHVSGKHRVAKRAHFVVVPVSGLKTIERDVAAKLPQRDRVVNAEKTTARGIDLVVTTNLARLACSFIV